MAQPFSDLKTPSPSQEEPVRVNSRTFRKHSPWTAARDKKKNRVAVTADHDILDQCDYHFNSPENVIRTASFAADGASIPCSLSAPENDTTTPSPHNSSASHSSPEVDRSEQCDLHPAKAYIIDRQEQLSCPSSASQDTQYSGGHRAPRATVWFGNNDLDQELDAAPDAPPMLNSSCPSSLPPSLPTDRSSWPTAQHHQDPIAAHQGPAPATAGASISVAFPAASGGMSSSLLTHHKGYSDHVPPLGRHHSFAGSSTRSSEHMPVVPQLKVGSCSLQGAPTLLHAGRSQEQQQNYRQQQQEQCLMPGILRSISIPGTQGTVVSNSSSFNFSSNQDQQHHQQHQQQEYGAKQPMCHDQQGGAAAAVGALGTAGGGVEAGAGWPPGYPGQGTQPRRRQLTARRGALKHTNSAPSAAAMHRLLGAAAAAGAPYNSSSFGGSTSCAGTGNCTAGGRGISSTSAGAGELPQSWQQQQGLSGSRGSAVRGGLDGEAAAAGVDEDEDLQWGITAEVQEQRELLGLMGGIRPLQLWGEEDAEEGAGAGAVPASSSREVCSGGGRQGGWRSSGAAAVMQRLVGSRGHSCWGDQSQQVDASSLAWFQQELDEATDEGDIPKAQQLWEQLTATGIKPDRKFMNTILQCWHYGGGSPLEAAELVREMCRVADIEPDGVTTRYLEAIDISWQQLEGGEEDFS